MQKTPTTKEPSPDRHVASEEFQRPPRSVFQRRRRVFFVSVAEGPGCSTAASSACGTLMGAFIEHGTVEVGMLSCEHGPALWYTRHARPTPDASVARFQKGKYAAFSAGWERNCLTSSYGRPFLRLRAATNFCSPVASGLGVGVGAGCGATCLLVVKILSRHCLDMCLNAKVVATTQHKKCLNILSMQESLNIDSIKKCVSAFCFIFCIDNAQGQLVSLINYFSTKSMGSNAIVSTQSSRQQPCVLDFGHCLT